MTEPRYILLAEGEKIQEGDEFYCHSPEGWHKSPPPHCVVSATYGPVRRKLEGWREIKDASSITRPCAFWAYNVLVGHLAGSEIPDWATHWLPLPPLPVKQSEADIAWADYCEKAGKQANDHTFTRAGFLAGFEAGRKK